MYANQNDPPPGLDEQYLVATNTSDLTLNPDGICSATHLIAAGLLGNRMGAALVHLRAEWDTADKPRKATEGEIAQHALTLPKNKGKPDVKRSRSMFLVGHVGAMRRCAHGLQGWRPALEILAEWARQRGVDVDLLSPALYHWLAPSCPVCDGVGRRWLFGSPTESKQCFHCNGMREPGQSEGPTIWPRPLGAERIHDWLKGCVGKAKGERAGLMHGRIDSDDLKERTANKRPPAAEEEGDAAAVAAHFRDAMGKRRKP